MKRNIIIIVICLAVIIGVVWVFSSSKKEGVRFDTDKTATTTADQAVSTSTMNKDQTVIGRSVGGRDIVAYHYGTGSKEILLVSDLHGGYEWNTALLGYQFADYFKANPTAIPAGTKVTVIPVANPDGLYETVGTTSRFSLSDVAKDTVPGRFNDNQVDLNRNFDCKWQAEAVWQSRKVSGGTAAFSEPETQAIRDYVLLNRPAAVIAFYSAANGVFSSTCSDSLSAETKSLTSVYAKASGYPAYSEFTSYQTTGDMTNWVTKLSIPAVSVLLTNHNDTDWTKNLSGVQAVLKSYAK